MADLVAIVDDLLFGSNLAGSLRAAGHQVTLVPNPARAAPAAREADLVVADLASGTLEPLEIIAALPDHRPPTLASYAHVNPDMRDRARRAGFDHVVPRSRLAREAPALVAALLAGR